MTRFTTKREPLRRATTLLAAAVLTISGFAINTAPASAADDPMTDPLDQITSPTGLADYWADPAYRITTDFTQITDLESAAQFADGFGSHTPSVAAIWRMGAQNAPRAWGTADRIGVAWRCSGRERQTGSFGGGQLAVTGGSLGTQGDLSWWSWGDWTCPPESRLISVDGYYIRTSDSSLAWNGDPASATAHVFHINTGAVDPAPVDPEPVDTDGDGLSDQDEADVYGTDPLSADTDGDGVSDGDEIATGTDPLVDDLVPPVPDPEQDTAYIEGTVRDQHGRPVEGYSVVAAWQVSDVASQRWATTGPDGTYRITIGRIGLKDWYSVEALHHDPVLGRWIVGSYDDPSTEESPERIRVTLGETRPNIDIVVRPEEASLDTDGDGLTDDHEIALGTDPQRADTDGDGVSDGAEIAAGTDPLTANSPSDPDPTNPTDPDTGEPTDPTAPTAGPEQPRLKVVARDRKPLSMWARGAWTVPVDPSVRFASARSDLAVGGYRVDATTAPQVVAGPGITVTRDGGGNWSVRRPRLDYSTMQGVRSADATITWIVLDPAGKPAALYVTTVRLIGPPPAVPTAKRLKRTAHLSKPLWIRIPNARKAGMTWSVSRYSHRGVVRFGQGRRAGQIRYIGDSVGRDRIVVKVCADHPSNRFCAPTRIRLRVIG